MLYVALTALTDTWTQLNILCPQTVLSPAQKIYDEIYNELDCYEE